MYCKSSRDEGDIRTTKILRVQDYILVLFAKAKVILKQNEENIREASDATSAVIEYIKQIKHHLSMISRSGYVCNMLIFANSKFIPFLPSRSQPNCKDILPKGIPLPETKLSESKLCKMASSKLQKTLPHIWRQVFNNMGLIVRQNASS